MTPGERAPPAHCPTVPTLGRGTVGQTAELRDDAWDKAGTDSLQNLARKVLAHLPEWDGVGQRRLFLSQRLRWAWDKIDMFLRLFHRSGHSPKLARVALRQGACSPVDMVASLGPANRSRTWS